MTIEHDTGVAVIQGVVATLPLAPGVYRMLDDKGRPLYVGKARSLKKRVYSYTQAHRLSERLRPPAIRGSRRREDRLRPLLRNRAA